MIVCDCVYETDLKVDQIKDLLVTEDERMSVGWDPRTNKFIVRRKRPFFAFRWGAVNHIQVKGEVIPTEERTFVKLSPGPVVNLRQGLLFVALTLLILLFAGKRMEIDYQTILMMFGLCTLFSFMMVYFWTRFTEYGNDMYRDVFLWIERVLELKKIDNTNY